MNREEMLKEKCPDCGATAESGEWYEKDATKNWGLLGVGPRYHCRNCDAFRVITPFDPSEEMTINRAVWHEAFRLLDAATSEPLKVGGEIDAALESVRMEVRAFLELHEGLSPGHIPMRGSEVESYIKLWRDEFENLPGDELVSAQHSVRARYLVLDEMLDDYRERADTGKSLLEADEDDDG